MSLSIKSGPVQPPAYKGKPEAFKGTVFAVKEAQAVKYIKGYTGPPIPAAWDDGNPRMQIVIYLVGATGKAMRLFVSKSKEEGSAWKAWVAAIEALNSESFEDIVGHTFLFDVKTTYKPNGEVAFRVWTIVESANEDYRPTMEDEWKDLPQGVLETFYYPGFSPEEMAAKRAAAPPAPPTTVEPPAPEPAQPVMDAEVYQEDIYNDVPF